MNFPVLLPPKFLETAAQLNIFPADIDEQFIRGGGHGGQKMNKTSSCVLLRHRPTGIEVRCQAFREQSKNRVKAYELLILKIEDKVKGHESEKSKKIFKLRKQKNKRSKRSREKMLEIKRRRSEIKGMRRPPTLGNL
ncbi:MAG: peptide chain release factor-like protein [Patescibacteria group bacterium]